MLYVAILYIVIFILIAMCWYHVCDGCEGPRLNIYAILVWTWVITLFLFAVFGAFIADEITQMMYMGIVGGISALFIFFILLWAIVDSYGYSAMTHKDMHALLCKLEKM